MSATSLLLEIPEVRARVSPITVAQDHQFPECNENDRRTELIRGIVIEKRSKSPCLRDSEPEPALSLVRGQRTDDAARHPSTAVLVIEVALTSAAEDRALAALYAEAGVDEYWIVLPVERRIEVHRRPEAGADLERFVCEGDATLAGASLPYVRVRLRDLF